MKKLILKIILCLVLFIILFYVGIFLAFIFSMTGHGDFYIPVIISSYISLLFLITITVFKKFRPKTRKTLWIIFSSGILLSCSVYEGINYYDNSIPKLSDNEINPELYEPFSEGTKAVSLNTLSTLKFESDLPRLDGATALYPLYSAFAQAVYPKNEYPVHSGIIRCSKTIDAYKSLAEGTTDIIFVMKPSEDQLKRAKDNNITFKLSPIGKEAFVFFVNINNPVDNLSIEQIQKIYSGEITNWKEVGGRNEEIKAFQRNENSGSQTAFQYFMKDKKIMHPPQEDIIAGMGAIIDRTADYKNYKNAIGFTFRFFANEMVNNKEIKLLRINDTEPNIANIRNNTYPLSGEFYAVTLNDTQNPHVSTFIDWILSEQGQYLVEKTGYVRVK